MSPAGAQRTAAALSARELRAYLGSLSVDELVDLVVEATRADERFAQRVTLSAAIARAEFQDRPAVDSYRALRERAEAGDRWPEVREQARAWLRARLATTRRQVSRTSDPWRRPADFSALVQILLCDEDVEAAWSAAVEGDCNETLWLDLARRRRDEHPVDARAVFQQLAQAAIERKGEHRYDGAIALVREAGALMSAADFAASRADLTDRYGRKRNLVPKLEVLA